MVSVCHRHLRGSQRENRDADVCRVEVGARGGEEDGAFRLRLSDGSGEARRYAPGFFPLVGFADPASPDFDALAPHCQPGERFYSDGWAGPAPAGWRSAVRTHPDHRGRDLARRLMTTLIRRQLQRNESPFLRVMVDNPTAHRLYEWMGFRDHRERSVRIVSYRATA